MLPDAQVKFCAPHLSLSPELHTQDPEAVVPLPMTDATSKESTIYLDKREAAAQLRISERTLSGWMRNRTIPFVKFGRTVRFRRVDLENGGVFFGARGR